MKNIQSSFPNPVNSKGSRINLIPLYRPYPKPWACLAAEPGLNLGMWSSAPIPCGVGSVLHCFQPWAVMQPPGLCLPTFIEELTLPALLQANCVRKSWTSVHKTWIPASMTPSASWRQRDSSKSKASWGSQWSWELGWGISLRNVSPSPPWVSQFCQRL